MSFDTYDRVDLTGPWAGFGFQGHRFFTPEGHDLHPSDMTWWSLTCNMAREWQLMMAEARRGVLDDYEERSPAGVIYLRDVLRRRAKSGQQAMVPGSPTGQRWSGQHGGRGDPGAGEAYP